jgi:hypothetical protein
MPCDVLDPDSQPLQPYVVPYRDAVEAVLTALQRAHGDPATLQQALGAIDVALIGGRVRHGRQPVRGGFHRAGATAAE